MVTGVERKGEGPDAEAIDAAALHYAIEDWSVMVGAVAARLQRAADDLLSGDDGTASTHRVAGSLLECAEALNQLHRAQVHEIARRQHIRCAFFDAPGRS